MSKHNKHNLEEPPVEIVPLREHEAFFSDETLESLRELGAVLEPIYRRLKAEGYTFENGLIYKKENGDTVVWK